MTTRDWQLKKNGGQWLLGKAMEAFAPIGPAIVSRDEVGDPNNLQLSCKVRTNGSPAAGHVTPCSSLIGWLVQVNGEVKQDSSTAQFVFPVAEVVSWVSR